MKKKKKGGGNKTNHLKSKPTRNTKKFSVNETGKKTSKWWRRAKQGQNRNCCLLCQRCLSIWENGWACAAGGGTVSTPAHQLHAGNFCVKAGLLNDGREETAHLPLMEKRKKSSSTLPNNKTKQKPKSQVSQHVGLRKPAIRGAVSWQLSFTWGAPLRAGLSEPAKHNERSVTDYFSFLNFILQMMLVSRPHIFVVTCPTFNHWQSYTDLNNQQKCCCDTCQSE